MTRLLTTVAAATLLALPAFAQAPSASGTADQAPSSGASGATIMPDSPSAKPKAKPSAKSEQGASEMHAIAPAAGGKGKSAQRDDPESGQIAELNRRELQRVESEQK